MAIRTCFFDMGNVLVFFSHERMVRNVAALAGWSEIRSRTFLIDEGRQWKLERGEMSEDRFHAEFCESVGKTVDQTELLDATADIFELNSSIIPVLQSLRAAGLRLVLLSNTSHAHIRFIERRWTVLQLLHDRVTSYEVGAMKPDDRIFLAALAKAECPSHECFYTDDMAPFIEKAASFGILGHQFTSTESLQAALVELRVL